MPLIIYDGSLAKFAAGKGDLRHYSKARINSEKKNDSNSTIMDKITNIIKIMTKANIKSIGKYIKQTKAIKRIKDFFLLSRIDNSLFFDVDCWISKVLIYCFALRPTHIAKGANSDKIIKTNILSSVGIWREKRDPSIRIKPGAKNGNSNGLPHAHKPTHKSAYAKNVTSIIAMANPATEMKSVTAFFVLRKNSRPAKKYNPSTISVWGITTAKTMKGSIKRKSIERKASTLMSMWIAIAIRLFVIMSGIFFNMSLFSTIDLHLRKSASSELKELSFWTVTLNGL